MILRSRFRSIATGIHLSPEFGLTYREIEKDGFSIDARVEMLLSSDTPVGIAKSLGVGVIGFADALHTLQPDLLMLLGDRFEILAAAQAALVAKIPIAHIAGGDTTEGAFDEAIRHSITKMSHLHFVTNEASAQRVRQLGENPEHVYTVGSPGVDVIKQVTLLDRKDNREGTRVLVPEVEPSCHFPSGNVGRSTCRHAVQGTPDCLWTHWQMIRNHLHYAECRYGRQGNDQDDRRIYGLAPSREGIRIVGPGPLSECDGRGRCSRRKFLQWSL